MIESKITNIRYSHLKDVYYGLLENLVGIFYRLQLFEDAKIDKEVDIRRRILRDFCKTEDEFDDLRSYNDYLEMVEDLIYNLCNNIDILETNKKINEYKEVNKAQIAKNKHKTKAELLELEDILAEEKSMADFIHTSHER